jgi:outer membrane immunogenic protein
MGGAAFGADLAYPIKDSAPVYGPAANWTGFYLGVNAGYGTGGATDQLTIPSILYYSTAGVRPEGGFAGGQIGYNWQGGGNSHLVFGVEADLQRASISDVQSGAYDGYSRDAESHLDWFGTVRGRLGYATENILVYATGGFAFGGVTNEVLNSYISTNFSTSNTAAGYVLGLGLEYKLSPVWSVKAEYQYLNLGKNDPRATSGETFVAYGGIVRDDDYHTARIGLNYHFQGYYEPLK